MYIPEFVCGIIVGAVAAAVVIIAAAMIHQKKGH